FTVNQDPPAPTPLTPTDGATVPTISPTLTVSPVTDPEGDSPVGYQFSVYSTASCTGTLVASSSWQTSVSWTVPSTYLLDQTQYWWCVISRDFVTKAVLGSAPSAIRSFTVALPKL